MRNRGAVHSGLTVRARAEGDIEQASFEYEGRSCAKVGTISRRALRVIQHDRDAGAILDLREMPLVKLTSLDCAKSASRIERHAAHQSVT